MLRPLLFFCCVVSVCLSCHSAHAQYIYTVAGGGKDTENIAPLKISVNPRCLFIDSDGSIYFTDMKWHAVRKYDVSTGKVITIAGGNGGGFSGDGGPAIGAKLNEPYAIRVDAAGKYLYIADHKNYRIRRVDFTTGYISTYAGNGTLGYSGDGGQALQAMLSVTGIALDENDNLFFTDAEAHVVRKIEKSTGVISTIAGNGTSGNSGDGGPALQAMMKAPTNIIFDEEGNLIITDLFNSNVRKVSTSGVITTVAGTGVSGFSGDGGPATSAQLGSPEGIALDQNGNLYITDRGKNRVRKVDASGIITTFAGNGVSNYQSDGVSATSTSSYALDIAVDPDGNIVTAEGYYRIRKIASATGVINTIIGNGSRSYEGNHTPATTAQMNRPNAVVRAPNGDLYIADDLNYCVRKVDATTSVITTVAGTGRQGFSANGNLASSSQLRSVDDIALDASGNLYIVESSANRVRKVDAATGLLSTVAGTGTDSFSGDGGLATSATLSSTKGICIDNDGNIFISDNNRVRKIDAVTKEITTVAGTGAYGYSGDGGPATSALLYYPSRLASDQNGNVYFSDNYSHRIRRIDKVTGILTTVAGQQQSRGFSGDGGLATAAKLDYPLGVSIDNAGNLYIADTQNSRIRKVDVSTGIITTVAGNGSTSTTQDGVLATAASLNEPEGITVGGDGRLYIADTDNDRVKVVKQRSALITFTKTVEVYNGASRPVSFTTDPPALNVTTTYNGATTAPVDAGSYEVKITSNDPQFEGSAFTTFTIAKAPQTLNFTVGPKALSDGSFDLNGTSTASLPVSYEIADPNVATVSGNHVTLVGLGSTTITASQAGNANYLPAENVQRTLNVVSFTAISAVTGNLDFGEVSVTESMQKSITISNGGTGVLEINGITVPEHFSVDKNVAQVQPGGSVQITVTFSPLEERNYDDKLTISSNATSGTQEVAITATGIAVTGVDEVPADAAVFEVFPNPSSGIIFIKTTSEQVPGILVVRPDGKTAAHVNLIRKEGNVFEADISSLPDGLYFIVGNKNRMARVLKDAKLSAQ